MPRIPNFPPAYLEEHKRWHDARERVDPDRPPAGYGLEFLQFHRRFTRKVLSWYRLSGLDPRWVEPWDLPPEPIRRASCYDRQAEERLARQPQTFASADEFGRFIESSGLHACLHQEAADLFGDPDLSDFDVAPRSTLFYNIHGMLDRWWQNWEASGRFRSKSGRDHSGP